MSVKIDRKNIRLFAATTALAVLTGTPIGLAIGCKKTDHTKELCPVTKLLNLLPSNSNDVPFGVKHQDTKYAEDFYSEKFAEQTGEEERVIVDSQYGKIIHKDEFSYETADGTIFVYENKGFEGEYGLTVRFNDDTENYLAFKKTDEKKDDIDFKLKKVTYPEKTRMF